MLRERGSLNRCTESEQAQPRRSRPAEEDRRHELVSEEILASLIGSLIVEREQNGRDLYHKALYEAVARGIDSTHVIRLLHDLRLLPEKAL